MKAFMDRDFMLMNETAKELFHQYAEHAPIIDYHCHLSAKEIYENKPAKNLTELWLAGDHYKWRAMRGNGIPEERITGNADDYDKFMAFAETLPFAIGNPLYHWTHLELQRYFGINEILSPETAPEIWKKTEELLSDGNHTPQYFIQQSNVYALCTTEDPADTLEYHEKLALEKKLDTKILPAYRPDNALSIEKASWKDYIAHLSRVSGIDIADWDSLLQDLKVRMDEFERLGCVASDHGVEALPFLPIGEAKAAEIVEKALQGQSLSENETDGYKTELLLWLGREYAKRSWAMELHMNAMRSCNTRAVEKLGEATGFDSVCDHSLALNLSGFMNELEKTGQLPKMILFSLNDADNMVIATMLGNFHDASVSSKIQMGSAWWFQDHADGMERQMRILANEGILGRFIGMLTDSRSFLSYPRHEYFRRILCNLIGTWVENGQYPGEMKTLGMLVERICYLNAKEYFGI